jgi:HlyD family type I secretion membrane fusion protein
MTELPAEPESNADSNLPARRPSAMVVKLGKVTAVAKSSFNAVCAATFGRGGDRPSDRLRGMLAGIVVVGLGIGGLMFGSLVLWAFLAPLASSAVAQGNVNPDSSRKTIQHLEGGIIRAIEVKDGDVVKQDQPLFILEPLAARSMYSAKRQQWMRLQVTRARLEAHRADQETFVPPTFPNFTADPDFPKFVKDQVDLFNARRRNFIERDQILRQQVAQLNEQKIGKTKENESLDKQREFILEEIEDKRELMSQNLVRKPEYLALMRASVDFIGRKESNLTELARIAERVGEVELSIVSNRTQFDQEISDQLAKANSDIAQLEETISTSEDVLKRTEIRAPVAGTVINIRFKTVGGVVRPGEALVDIVPMNDNLIIDAKLSPNDIDVVHRGLPAEVYLTPYVSRHTPRLKGTVTYVGADIAHEAPPASAGGAAAAASPPSPPSYYEIKVQVDAKELHHAVGLEMYPGMPAEVYVMTGTRSFGQYLLDPVRKSFRRAFVED